MSVRNIVKEIIDEESAAAKAAKKAGLVHLGFGRYGPKKGGSATHVSKDGKLKSVGDDSGGEPADKPFGGDTGTDADYEPSQQAQAHTAAADAELDRIDKEKLAKGEPLDGTPLFPDDEEPEQSAYDKMGPEARELKNTMDSTEEGYQQQYVPILKNLSRKMKKGTYDKEKAVKLFMYYVDNGAKRYAKDFGGGGATGPSVGGFDKKTREEAARAYVEDFEDDWDNKNWDFMESIVKKSKTAKEFGESKMKLESLLKENPAAMAAVQQMAAVKLQGKGKRKVKATTALTNKEHPSHEKAVSIFQKLKDKFSKKKEDEPKKQSQSDADFYKKQYVARTGTELDEGWWEDLTDKARELYKKAHPGSKQAGGGSSDDEGGKSKDVQDQEKREKYKGHRSWLGIPIHADGEPVDPDDIDDEGNLLPGKEDPENRSGGADPRRGSARTGNELGENKMNESVKFHTITGNKRFMTKTALVILRKYGVKNVKVNQVAGDFLEIRFPIDSNKLKKLDKELKRKNKTAYGGIVENRRDKMKITEGILRKVIRSEIKKTLIKESSPGFTKREFGDPLPTLQGVMKQHQNKVVKEDDDAFSQPIPATIDRFMKKFISAVNDKNLNRKRKLAILGRVIVALRLEPSEVSKYARLVKREL